MIRCVQTNTPKIIAVGKNYLTHVKEMGWSSAPAKPLLFLKPPSSIVKPPSKIRIPGDVVVHHEVEMGLVVGKEGTNIPEEHGRDHIAGIACCIDLTARDLQTEAKKGGNPWTISKGFDTFLPMSDIVPVEEFDDLDALKLSLSVNGDLKQDDSTSSMISNVNYLVSYISSVMTLVPGDLILTGTPAGVGPLVSGDVVEANVDKVRVKFECEKA